MPYFPVASILFPALISVAFNWSECRIVATAHIRHFSDTTEDHLRWFSVLSAPTTRLGPVLSTNAEAVRLSVQCHVGSLRRFGLRLNRQRIFFPGDDLPL